MDKRDFWFVRDFPELEPLVRKVIKRFAVYHYDDIWIVIDIVYRAGYSQGVAKALEALGFKHDCTPVFRNGDHRE